MRAAMSTIASIERYRGELAGFDVLMLAADPDVPDHQAAATALGLHPRAEPDGPPPSCGWCGRSDPPGGLEDQSMGGPPVHECVDGASCQGARASQMGYWMDKQFKVWRIDLDKMRRVQQYEAEQAARSRFGGGIYQLAGDVEDPEFILALAHVRDAVDQRAPGYLESFDRVGAKALELAASLPGITDPATPQAPPEPVKFGHWDHTLQNPANRTHLLGHHLQHKGVHDAAGAVARREVLKRQAEDSQQRLPGISAWCGQLCRLTGHGPAAGHQNRRPEAPFLLGTGPAAARNRRPVGEHQERAALCVPDAGEARGLRGRAD